MLSKGYNLKADVLKVGHHGSDTSTASAFLKAVAPKYAVISVGKNNDYGHPAPETLARLSKIQVFRTDLQGTILATSDGNTFSFNKKALPVPVTKPSISSVAIINIDLQGETVTIKNSGKAAASLSGWVLVSEKGNQKYTFPSGTVLPAGGILKVVSGPSAKIGSGILLWTKSNMWNNDGDPGALYDSQGKLVSRFQ